MYLYLKTSEVVWILTIILTVLLFVVVYILDLRFLKILAINKSLMQINDEEIAYLKGELSAFNDGNQFIDHDHNYSFDLDIFGTGSIYQALNRTVSKEGEVTLANWLLKTDVSENEIIDKQNAVKTLSGLIDFRQMFRAYGMQNELDFKTLAKQFETKKLPVNKTHLMICYLIVAVTLLVAALTIFGFMGYHLLVLLFFGQILLAGMKSKMTQSRYNKLDGFYKSMKVYDDLLKHIKLNEELLKSEYLNSLITVLISGNNSASEAFTELKKLLSRFDQRGNLLIAVLTNGFLLSDLFLNIRYQKWINRFIDEIDRYINAFGEFEALLCLSNFSYNHPDFCYPVLSNKELISGKKLGHPLIDANTRVCNDYEVSSQKSYSLVTGANMAGKSTFLRTVGINLVLASCGCTVCAKEFLFRPMVLFSSMRTSDNLVNQISYFQAELLRLKKLIDVIKNHQITFIILDEILKGTNSKDKLAGSRLFLKSLLNYNASGIVATHDLALGELATELPNHFNNICFEISIDGDDISYDYKLQEGIAKNMNATYLINRILSVD